MSQTRKVQGRSTTVFTDETGALCCAYHATIVARKLPAHRFEGSDVGVDTRPRAVCQVQLNSGGWRTVTTKTRMNQFANQHCGRQFVVYQENGAWRVLLGVGAGPVDAQHLDFVDGMTFEVSI